MSFGLDLGKFEQKVYRRLNSVCRGVVIAVDRSLVEKSPVGNPNLWAGSAPAGYVGGRFRANWQYGENVMPQGKLWAPIVGPYPDANPISVAPEAGGKMHYLVNNLPYAQALEDGHSALQAPMGMVGITVIEFIPIVKAAVEEAKL